MRIKKVFLTSKFKRNFKNLSAPAQRKAVEREQVFRDNPFHPFLKTHKLKGKFEGCHSFSIDYKFRIVFVFESQEVVTFFDVGTHEVYR